MEKNREFELLSLPVTRRDYITFCRNKDFESIDLVSEELLKFESRLVTAEAASLVIANGYIDLISIIPRSQDTQATLLKSFIRVCRRFQGKPIFLGFIPDCNKYIIGAIIPIDQKGVIIVYLPVPPNSPKVLCSPSLREQIHFFLVEFTNIWKDEIDCYGVGPTI